ncbi:hypothetical protein H1R20_g8045, partial [Candolleomyces eurysporus]
MSDIQRWYRYFVEKQILEKVSLSFDTAYVYHYSTTLDDEVNRIWPEKWGTGKILFLVTRYAMLGSVVFDFLRDRPLYVMLPLKMCKASLLLINLMPFLSIIAAEASLWLCMYALLGAKRRYLAILMAIFATFAISCLVLMLIELTSWKAVRPIDFMQTLGYTCAYSASEVKAQAAVAVVSYIKLAWATREWKFIAYTFNDGDQ